MSLPLRSHKSIYIAVLWMVALTFLLSCEADIPVSEPYTPVAYDGNSTLPGASVDTRGGELTEQSEGCVYRNLPPIYTPQNYDFDGNIAALHQEILDVVKATKGYGNATIIQNTEIEGVVTMRSNWYIKDGSDKYYGCFIIQDQNAGIMVLHESDKEPYVEFGDRVQLVVVTAMRSYDVNYIKADHELVAGCAVTKNNPNAYEVPTTSLNASYVGKVVKLSGTVTVAMNEFGEFFFTNGANSYMGSVSMDLQKSGINYLQGGSVSITGPVFYSYENYKVCLDHEDQLK